MAFLLDTNIFLRLAERNSDLRENVIKAIRVLRFKNEEICFTPQIVSEFWNACTRPQFARGGFGLSIDQTERKVLLIEKHFRCLPDSLATFNEWRKLVKEKSVIGVQVHDAKIAASMTVYGIHNLLTFNVGDFKRFEFINATDPRDFDEKGYPF